MRDYVVLVGNDINNIVAGKSWEDLLKDLTEHLSISVDFPKDKPFPLAYEEIYFKGLDTSGSFDERVVKRFVASHVSDIQSSTIHKRLMELSCENILTTNYDLSLESVLSSNTKSLKIVVTSKSHFTICFVIMKLGIKSLAYSWFCKCLSIYNIRL